MLYITYYNINLTIGIKKKIMAQCRVFQKVLGKTYYTMYAGQMMYLLQEEQIVDKEFASTQKMCNEVLLQWIGKYDIDQVYIRYDLSDIWFIKFLKALKDRSIKCVLEFPTFPYDGEGWGRRPIEDNYYREQIHQYIDCCTTYSNYNTVFEIPCITLVNGVNIEEQPPKKYRKPDGSIILAAVATMSKWHGYERVIQGMYNYYSNGGQRNIIFNVVGDGDQIQYYKKIVDEYQLCEHVAFHGQLSGTKLDDIYDNSDIAIGSLGFYKINLYSNAPIKLREYCARGIPFVYGYDDISFSENNYFAYRISNDATLVDIKKIIEFYETVYDGRDFIKDMREYTLRYLTWDKILQPVIDYLKG